MNDSPQHSSGSSQTRVNGFVAPGFERVREEFIRNFDERGELGGACAAFRDGELIVDLWGGDARPGVPWQKDTLVLVYSLSKGITGLTVALANSRGLIDYDAPVVEIWPEFGAAGKHEISVRQLLDQQAGLCAIEKTLNAQVMRDGHALAAVLASQRPAWLPGDRAGNHAYSLGWLVSELISRTDPQKRTLGTYLADELAGPLGADIFFGLPASIPYDRIADIRGIRPVSMARHWRTLGLGLVAYMTPSWTLTARTWNNPKVSKLDPRGPAAFNTPEYWKVENGGSGGIGNARAIAKLYGEFASGGQTLRLSSSTLDQLKADPRKPRKGWFDPIIRDEVRYSLCFEKPAPNNAFGTSGEAFGTFAIGGSYAFADPATRTGYCFVTNRIGPYVWGDPRELSVRQAVFR